MFSFQLCGHDMEDGTSVYTQYSEDNNLSELSIIYFLPIIFCHLKIGLIITEICMFAGSFQSVQQLKFHESQNTSDLNYMTKMDGSTINHDLNLSEQDKEVSSPTQPKTLQQEFSLININIPNIEVKTFKK